MKAIVLFLSFTLFLSSCSNYSDGWAKNYDQKNNGEETSKKQAIIVFSLDGIAMEQLKVYDPEFVAKYQVSPLRPNSHSLTFPGHATLATGVTPEQHGVKSNIPSPNELPFMLEYTAQKANSFLNFSNRLKVAPIWLLAKKKNIEVHIHHWSMARHKWCGQSIRDNQEKEFNLREVSVGKTAEAVTSKLITWNKKKDLLIYAYSLGLDKPGHALGPFHDGVLKAWMIHKKSIEALINTVTLAAKASDIAIKLYFVSDHGMFPIMADQILDLKRFLKTIAVDPIQKIRTAGKLQFMIPGQEYTNKQLEALSEFFSIVKGKLGDFSFRVKKRKFGFVLDMDGINCNKKNQEKPYLWGDCQNVVASGHHDSRDPEAIASLIDGIYFSVIPNGQKPEAPKMQSEFVPIIANDLGIDLKTQKSFKSCQVKSTL